MQVQFADVEYDEHMLTRIEARGKAFDAEAIRAFLARLAGEPRITDLGAHWHARQRRSAAVARLASEMYGARFDHNYEGYKS